MDDKTRAKELAKAHKAALTEWHNPLLEDTERPRIRALMIGLTEKRQTHMDKTGWAYDVPNDPRKPGRWSHSTGTKWDRHTEWIEDEKETEQ